VKIKTNIEFQAYKDGICNIYSENEDGDKVYKHKNLAFDDRVMGFKRAYAAKSVQSDINRVIRIPLLNGIDNFDVVEILSNTYYIDLVQQIFDSNPSSIDLTLKKVGGH